MTESKSVHNFSGITGSTLKLIALVSMLLDHIGAVLVTASVPYYALRLIGRIAFPIFCFLLVEGFFHTKNLTKYAIRLFLFALISEIPFDLAFHHTLFYIDSQNVFFTLLIGLMVITAMHRLELLFKDKFFLYCLCRAIVLVTGMAAAWFLQTDYSYIGILTIALLYAFHHKRTVAATGACFFLCFSSSMEITSLIAVPLIGAYNGKRGLSLKYVFYLFYPIHLLILYLISFWIF